MTRYCDNCNCQQNLGWLCQIEQPFKPPIVAGKVKCALFVRPHEIEDIIEYSPDEILRLRTAEFLFG